MIQPFELTEVNFDFMGIVRTVFNTAIVDYGNGTFIWGDTRCAVNCLDTREQGDFFLLNMQNNNQFNYVNNGTVFTRDPSVQINQTQLPAVSVNEPSTLVILAFGMFGFVARKFQR